jgi:hypothetical protein
VNKLISPFAAGLVSLAMLSPGTAPIVVVVNAQRSAPCGHPQPDPLATSGSVHPLTVLK